MPPRIANVRVEISQIQGDASKIRNIKADPSTAVDVTYKTRNFWYRESLLTGLVDWQLTLNADFLPSEEEFIYGKGARAIRLSLNRDGIEQTNGWKLVTVKGSSLTYEGSRPVVKIVGGSLAEQLRRPIKWRSFSSVPATSVLLRIADENGFILRNTPIPKTGTWYQLGTDDWSFLQYFIREVGAGSSTRKLWAFVNNQYLDVKAIDYSRPVVKSIGIGSDDDLAREVCFRYHGSETDYAGGSALNIRGFDIANKRYISASPPDNSIPSLAGRLPVAYASSRRRFFSTLQSADLLLDEATAKWAEETTKYFSVQVKMLGDLSVELGKLIEVKVIDPDGKASAMNGKYPVFEIFQQLEEGDLTTHVGGFRRTLHFGDISTSGANFSKLPTEQLRSEDQPRVTVRSTELR